jgi:hypothetical protein
MIRRILPSLLNASDAEVAAFRARLRDSYWVPPGTPSDKADLVFEELADKIIAYLSSPDPKAPDPPYYVGSCRSCGAEDCHAIAAPWASKLIYCEGGAYVSGGLCCAHHIGWSAMGRCAHPMVSAG